MQRKFLSNLILLLALNLLIKPLWILGIDRGFQNTIGFEAYGNFANLFVFSLILSVILDLGINNFVSSSLAKSPETIHAIFFPLLGIKLLFGFVYIGFTAMAGWSYGFSSTSLMLLFWLCLNQLLAFLSTFLRSNITGLQLYKTDAWLSVTDRFVMLILGAAMVWFKWLPASLPMFIGIQTIGYLIALFASFSVLKPHLAGANIQWKLSAIYPVFKQALPFAILALFMMSYTRADNLLLKKLHISGDLENGVYVAGGRILEAANMMAVLISGMLLPALSANLLQQNQLKSLLRLALLALVATGIFASIFCWFYRFQLISLLYKEASAYAADVFGVQMLSYLMLCGMYVFGTLLTASHQLKLLNILAAIALILNLLLNAYLIPGYGAIACAWIGLGTHGFICITNAFFALRKTNTGLSLSDLIRYMVLTLATTGLIWLFYWLNLSLIPAFFASVVCWMALLFMLKLTDFKAVKVLISGNP